MMEIKNFQHAKKHRFFSMMKKDTLPLFLGIIITLALAFLIGKPTITGFAVYEQVSFDSNVTYENSTVNPEQNLSITLFNINKNWTNYTSANITLNNSNLVLTSQNYFNLTIQPYNETYLNITWNLTAQSLGFTNITITLKNKTGSIFNKSIIINVTPIADNVLVFNKTKGFVKNNSYFNVTLVNLNNSWQNYTSAQISFDSAKTANTSSLFVDLSTISPYQNTTWTLQAKDKGNLTVNLTVTDKWSNVFYYNTSIGSYAKTDCADISFYPNSYDPYYYPRVLRFNTSLANFGSGNYDFYEAFSQTLNFNNTGTLTKTVNGTFDPAQQIEFISSLENNSKEEYFFYADIYKSTHDYCTRNLTLDFRPLVDDIVLNASFNGPKSCDNLTQFYVIDTNTTEMWNRYENLTINFTDGFNVTSTTIYLNNTVSIINLTGVGCTKNNVLSYELMFIGNTSNKTANRSIDLYYPTCKDMEVRPFCQGSTAYELNAFNYCQDISGGLLRLVDNNIYNGALNYYGYDNINILWNNTSIVEWTNISSVFCQNNTCLLNSSNLVVSQVSFLKNVSFNTSKAQADNNTFNFTINASTNYNNFSCVLQLNFYDTEYPFINITIIPDKTTISSGATVNLFFNITNTGDNITNIIISVFGTSSCGPFSIQNISTNQTINKTCSITPSSTTTITTTSTYGADNIQSNEFWITEGSITISVQSGSGSSDTTDRGGSSPLIGSSSSEEENSNTQNQDEQGMQKTVEEEMPAPILEDDETSSDSKNKKISKLLNNLTHFRAYVYRYGKTEVRDHIKNPSILTQYDVFAKVTIPKNIVSTTDEITGNFTVLEHDPKILFYYEKILSGQDILLNYTINKELTESEINQIIIEVNSSFSQKDIEELEQKAKQTSKNLDIKIDVKKTADNKTKITAILDPDKDLGKTKVYMEIPKCLAEHLSEIEFERQDYEVIQDDPLIAWSFDEITTQQSLEFKVLKEVDQNCWEQIIVLPIADEIKGALTRQTDWYYKFWPLLLIVIIMIIVPLISKHSHVLKKDKNIGKHALHKDILKELEFGFEELALSLIIILNVLDFFEILPPDLDFAKKVISWTFLGYLLYQVDITNILFGIKNNYQDLLLIFGYFGLMLSDVFNAFTVMFIEITDSGAQTFIQPFLNFILPFSNEIITLGFYIGVGIILLLTILDFSKEIKAPSTMAALHEEGKPSSLYKYVERFFLVMFAYFVFFVIFFKFFMEWFAISVDAVIAVVGIVVYFLTFVKKHHKHYHEEHFVFKIGTLGEEFYQKFLGFFADRKMIVFGLTGMLVLHLLVDLSSFVIPYVIGIKDSLYFLQLSTGDVLLNHTPVIPLIKSIWTANWALNLKIIVVYVLEFIAIVMFLILPAIIWYDIETGHKVTAHWLLNGGFIAGLVMFFQIPLFRLEPILGKEIVGIDLLLLNIFDITQSFDTALYVALGVGWLVLLLSFSKRLNKLFMILGVAFSQVFFLGYVYSYIVSWSDFFTNAIPAMFTAKKYLIGGVFALFFGIIVMFYVMGFIAYLLVIIDRWGKAKIKEHDKNESVMKVLVPYIEKLGDLSLARHQLEDKGWPKEIVHEAVIRAIQVEEKVKRFFFFEKRKKINKEIAKHELISHGWSEIAANNLIKRYW